MDAGAHFWCQCAQTKVKVGEAPPCDDDSALMTSCGEGLCFNGGTCLQPSNTCVCAPGYTGTWCTAGMYAATSGQSQVCYYVTSGQQLASYLREMYDIVAHASFSTVQKLGKFYCDI